MTIKFNQSVSNVAGANYTSGQTATLDTQTEHRIVGLNLASWVGTPPPIADAATGVNVAASGRGEIALYGSETWNGSAFSGAGCVVATSVFSGTSLGTTIAWNGTGGPVGSVDGVLFDTTAGGVFDPLQPERITIPAGVTMASFTGSASFPAQALGERWLRLVVGASTHMSSVSFPATTTPTIQNIQLNTGWIPVTAGEYYTLHVVQNSGSSITLASGNYSNKGGSTFFRASFK